MRVPKEFIKNLQGKEFVLMGGLLELAHQDGLSFTHTEILQFPSQNNDNTTIVRAIVRTGKGEFSGIGDASPASVPNKSIAVHSIRMAETRAVARALRVATNVSMTAFEELGEMNDEPKYEPVQQKTGGYTPKPKVTPAPEPKAEPKAVQPPAPKADAADSQGMSTIGQREEIQELCAEKNSGGKKFQDLLKEQNFTWAKLTYDQAETVIKILKAM